MVRIGEAAKILGVSAQTLRNWEKTRKIRSERSGGKHRFYSLKDLEDFALDFKSLALAWATSSIAPDLPSKYYCERPDRFTSRVAKMGTDLQKIGHVPEDLASLLTLAAGEIGDNSFAHNIGNWPDVQGIFYAYDIEKRVIVIADRGRGIRATLSEVRPDLITDTQAMNVAFTEIVSGRNPEKRGNGLKVVRSAIEKNAIGLHFQSGLAILKIALTKPSQMKIKMSRDYIRGTYAVILF